MHHIYGVKTDFVRVQLSQLRLGSEAAPKGIRLNP